MATRAGQLQIRVTAREKAALRRSARAAGQSISAYVLARALPDHALAFARVLKALEDDANRRFALAELSDVLRRLVPVEFQDAVRQADVRALSPLLQNYVAAMVEQAAHELGLCAPDWTRTVAPLEQPYFAAPGIRLRRYLLRTAPVAFRRRNIFAESGLDRRV